MFLPGWISRSRLLSVLAPSPLRRQSQGAPHLLDGRRIFQDDAGFRCLVEIVDFLIQGAMVQEFIERLGHLERTGVQRHHLRGFPCQ